MGGGWEGKEVGRVHGKRGEAEGERGVGHGGEEGGGARR